MLLDWVAQAATQAYQTIVALLKLPVTFRDGTDQDCQQLLADGRHAYSVLAGQNLAAGKIGPARAHFNQGVGRADKFQRTDPDKIVAEQALGRR